MKITFSNSKLGDKIPSINLPVSICRADAPCKGKGCYACKGHFLYKNVQQSMKNNLLDFFVDGNKFFDDIIKALSGDDIIYKFFRWFGSGDIVNEKFFDGMIRVAKACPQTKFLAFTKKFDIVNNFISNGNKIPSNLKIIFSAWDKDFKVENPYNMPVAYIKFKEIDKTPQIPETAIPCKGSCKDCKGCWSLERGQAVYFDKH